MQVVLIELHTLFWLGPEVVVVHIFAVSYYSLSSTFWLVAHVQLYVWVPSSSKCLKFFDKNLVYMKASKVQNCARKR